MSRRARRTTPSSAYYVGYAEDWETPEMIMRKFQELEQLQQPAAAAPVPAEAAAEAEPALAPGALEELFNRTSHMSARQLSFEGQKLYVQDEDAELQLVVNDEDVLQVSGDEDDDVQLCEEDFYHPSGDEDEGPRRARRAGKRVRAAGDEGSGSDAPPRRRAAVSDDDFGFDSDTAAPAHQRGKRRRAAAPAAAVGSSDGEDGADSSAESDERLSDDEDLIVGVMKHPPFYRSAHLHYAKRLLRGARRIHVDDIVVRTVQPYRPTSAAQLQRAGLKSTPGEPYPPGPLTAVAQKQQKQLEHTLHRGDLEDPATLLATLRKTPEVLRRPPTSPEFARLPNVFLDYVGMLVSPPASVDFAGWVGRFPWTTAFPHGLVMLWCREDTLAAVQRAAEAVGLRYCDVYVQMYEDDSGTSASGLARLGRCRRGRMQVDTCHDVLLIFRSLHASLPTLQISQQRTPDLAVVKGPRGHPNTPDVYTMVERIVPWGRIAEVWGNPSNKRRRFVTFVPDSVV